MKKTEHQIVAAASNLADKGINRVSAGQVSTYLIDEVGLNISAKAVRYHLKNKKLFHHKSSDGYALMEEGRELLADIVNAGTFTFIDSTKPFSDKFFTLGELLDNGYKKVHICDPYLDTVTLEVIVKNFKVGTPIKFVTKNIVDPRSTLVKGLKDAKKEGFLLEVRVKDKDNIHDRYLITDKEMLVMGTSLNGLGNKESFVIKLGEDIRVEMLLHFEEMWKKAPPYFS